MKKDRQRVVCVTCKLGTKEDDHELVVCPQCKALVHHSPVCGSYEGDVFRCSKHGKTDVQKCIEQEEEEAKSGA